MGVTKAPFVNFSVKENFALVKERGRLFKSHPHLTDITAAKLRRHLSKINVVFNRQALIFI